MPKRQNKSLVDRKMFKSNIYHKTRQSPLKLEILVANTKLSGNLFQKFMTRLWNISSPLIFSTWYFFSLQLFPLVCVAAEATKTLVGSISLKPFNSL